LLHGGGEAEENATDQSKLMRETTEGHQGHEGDTKGAKTQTTRDLSAVALAKAEARQYPLRELRAFFVTFVFPLFFERFSARCA
jgi:hypothetical protein